MPSRGSSKIPTLPLGNSARAPRSKAAAPRAVPTSRVDSAGKPPREPDPSRIQQFGTYYGLLPVWGWTVEALVSALEGHNVGNFQASGRLAEDMTAHPWIRHGLTVRDEFFTTCPLNFTPAGRTLAEQRRSKRCADFVREIWPDVMPLATLKDLHRHELFMGQGIYAIDWEERRDGRDRWWIPCVKPWEPSLTGYRQFTDPDSIDGGGYTATTLSHGLLRVQPGGGRWGMFSRRTLRPWLSGIVRVLGEAFTGDGYNFRDNMTHQDRWGRGIVKLKYLRSLRTDEVNAATASLVEGGGGGVLQCPVDENGKPLLDADLLRADGAGYQTFDATEKRILRRVLIALLRQDMTTTGTTGIADNDPRQMSLWKCREDDATTYGDARCMTEWEDIGGMRRPIPVWEPCDGALRQHLTRWIAHFNFGEFDLAPYVWWDATPPDDYEQRRDAEAKRGQQRASTLQALASAAKAFGDQGVRCDVAHLADQCGMTLVKPDEDGNVPPEPLKATPKPQGGAGGAPAPAGPPPAALPPASGRPGAAAKRAETREEDRDVAPRITGDDLSGIQVRISAAGAPFHPGHTPGIGPHGELAGSFLSGAEHAKAAAHHANATAGHAAEAAGAMTIAETEKHAAAAAASAAMAAAHAEEAKKLGVDAGKHAATAKATADEAASYHSAMHESAKENHADALAAGDKSQEHAKAALDAAAAAEATKQANLAAMHASEAAVHAHNIAMLGGDATEAHAAAAKAKEEAAKAKAHAGELAKAELQKKAAIAHHEEKSNEAAAEAQAAFAAAKEATFAVDAANQLAKAEAAHAKSLAAFEELKKLGVTGEAYEKADFNAEYAGQVAEKIGKMHADKKAAEHAALVAHYTGIAHNATESASDSHEKAMTAHTAAEAAMHAEEAAKFAAASKKYADNVEKLAPGSSEAQEAAESARTAAGSAEKAKIIAQSMANNEAKAKEEMAAKMEAEKVEKAQKAQHDAEKTKLEIDYNGKALKLIEEIDAHTDLAKGSSDGAEAAFHAKKAAQKFEEIELMKAHLDEVGANSSTLGVYQHTASVYAKKAQAAADALSTSAMKIDAAAKAAHHAESNLTISLDQADWQTTHEGAQKQIDKATKYLADLKAAHAELEKLGASVHAANAAEAIAQGEEYLSYTKTAAAKKAAGAPSIETSNKAAIAHHEKEASAHVEHVVAQKHEMESATTKSQAQYHLSLLEHHAAQVEHHSNEKMKLDGEPDIDLKIAKGNLASAKAAFEKKWGPAEAAQKAAVSAPVAAPGDTAKASNILATKIEGAKGSNEGGVYVGADGVKRYVKVYKNASQAHDEHLANALYNELGLGAPKSTVFVHEGKTHYASEWIEGAQTMKSASDSASASDVAYIHGHKVPKALAKEAMKGFAADVLLGNWDAAGLTHDNFATAGGKLIRVDNGGSLLHRAQGEKKPAHLLHQITEWDSFTNPSVNAAYAAVHAVGKPTPTQLIAQIKGVTSLEKKHGSWMGVVEKFAPNMPSDQKAEVAKMLAIRANLLKAKAAELQSAKAAKKAGKSGGPTQVGHVVDYHNTSVGESVNKHTSNLQHDSSKSTAFYSDLHKKAGLTSDDFHSLRSVIGEWTGEYRSGSTHKSLFAASRKLMENGTGDGGSHATLMQKHAAAREAKWRALLDSLGHHDVPTPTHFDLYRGMKGDDMVKAVAKAWIDPASTHATLPHDPVASWSMSKKTGMTFASQHSVDDKGNHVGALSSSPGVLMKWRAPMANTLADQAVDNGTFISAFHHEHEVIAGPGHSKGLPLPKENFEVFHNGKRYTYDQRHELGKALGLI